MPFPSTSVYFKWDKRCLELVGLALTTLKEEEIVDYIEWAFVVEGYDYEHEQIDPETDFFFKNLKLDRNLFYPFAWRGLDKYFADPILNGWDVAKGIVLLDKAICYDYDDYCDEEGDGETSLIDLNSFSLNWIKNAKEYIDLSKAS